MYICWDYHYFGSIFFLPENDLIIMQKKQNQQNEYQTHCQKKRKIGKSLI